MPHRVQTIVAAAATWAVMIAAVPLLAETGRPRLEGKAAFGDWSMDKPGTRRLIRPQDLPTADQAHSATNFLYHVARSERQRPSVPTGFDVKLFASGLSHQRLIRVAPNGDVFAAESEAGRIRVLRPNGGQSAAASIFADGLHGPFGIAFYPPGHDPSWVYVGNTDSVVRFAYRSGDLKARAPAESIVPRLPTGGSHRTRDVVFSPDGRTMYVSVGSASNVGDGMKKLSAAELHAWQSTQPLGAAWGNETDRAAVLAFDPEGKNKRIFATGIRNCVGMAVAPASGELWCSTNERDGLGYDVPTDYVTHVREARLLEPFQTHRLQGHSRHTEGRGTDL